MSHLQPLSDRVREIPHALSIYVNQLVYDMRRMKRDVITLSLGEAFFDIPLFEFNKIDPNEGYHYSDSAGLPALRAKVASYYQKYYGAQVDPQAEMIISAGSKPIIFMCVAAVVNAGDEVLIHEPAWLSYQEHVRLVDGVSRFIPYDCPVENFSDYFTEKTKIIVINNPNNPAGRLYSREDLQVIYDQAKSRNIWLLVDEAYSDFVVDERFVSIAEVVPDKAGVFVVNSLSKNMGMSGWRIGYVISSKEMIPQLLKLNQHLITCAPSVLQHYMALYFDDIINITLPQVRDVVTKRTRVIGMLDRLGMGYLDGGCTFYIFVSIADFSGSGMDFALKMLIDFGVAVVPGVAYGESTERFVRVSIGSESEDRIYKALQMMRDLIHSDDFDRQALHMQMKSAGIPPFSEEDSAHASG